MGTLTRFQFESVADMLLMDGHGFYVWLCLIAFLTGVSLLLASPFKKRKKLKRAIALARTLNSNED